jgi:Fur family ferric uptake transcriptional regulator
MNNNATDKDGLNILQRADISKTPQRLAVLNILLKSTTPLNVSCVRELLTGKNRIDRVTVYRILSLFKQRGIIREITSTGGVNFIEMATQENPVHPHFSCRSCGMLSCLEPLTFSQSHQLISAKEDYSVDHIDITISGICSGCRNATMLQKQSGKGEQ